MAISIPIYFIKCRKYLHRFGILKVDGSSLNTKKSEHIVAGYFQIIKKPKPVETTLALPLSLELTSFKVIIIYFKHVEAALCCLDMLIKPR
jgi:hypothetical protein